MTQFLIKYINRFFTSMVFVNTNKIKLVFAIFIVLISIYDFPVKKKPFKWFSVWLKLYVYMNFV